MTEAPSCLETDYHDRADTEHLEWWVMMRIKLQAPLTHAAATNVSSKPQFLFKIPLVYSRATTKVELNKVGIIAPAKIWATLESFAVTYVISVAE